MIIAKNLLIAEMQLPRQTACINVLGTAELLEATLTELPMRNLLLAQRVCKFWKESIGNSNRLQKALLFNSASSILTLDASCGRLDQRDSPHFSGGTGIVFITNNTIATVLQTRTCVVKPTRQAAHTEARRLVPCWGIPRVPVRRVHHAQEMVRTRELASCATARIR